MNTHTEIQAAETARPYYDPMADWDLIPSHMHGAVRRYVMHGIAPGQFLTAVLCNDLKEAFARADDDNTAAMLGWVRFMHNYMPANSQGSLDQFRAWLERGGLASEAEAA